MAYIANRLKARALRRMVDFDPDGTSAVVVTLDPDNSRKCLPLSLGIEGLLIGVLKTVGTAAITAFRIIATDAADGTGHVTTVVTHALTAAPAAVGDRAWLEATGEQIRAASATAAYVGVELTLTTGTDECAVTAEALLTSACDGLTADYIAA